MKLAIDAMSGDLGSPVVVEACLSFLKKNDNVELYVVGKLDELSALKDHPKVTLVEANEVLEMTENIMAIRRKKESSMVRAMMLAKNGEVDGVVSSGNTGAFYASAMLFVKRIAGVEKSCLMARMPTLDGKGILMLDVGANSDNTPEQLVSFAVMGNVYAKNVLNIEKPKVGLLNIGTEEHKGDDMHRAAYHLLQEKEGIHFIGNIEGKHILDGDVDIVVTDGFTGNVCMKSFEGASALLMQGLKENMMANTISKIGALFSKGALRSLKHTFDADSAGGALLIGFEKPIVKAHGASNAVAFENGIILTANMVENDVTSKIKAGLE
ncbi:phosphate acyltransferase PlsX [Tannockella kyphosi]|uniref:phosphate acyltransferase PlsX n=1 Tax=Tannockella kyphosi TaxID=2899121 RepID=UPI002011933C|nr:phosphate acyltransferase PlsX [Tannockella kyphosi]